MKHIKEHLLPVILILLGVLDQTTDLLIDLISQLGLPGYVGTIVKITIITLGTIKLYLSQPNKFKNE